MVQQQLQLERGVRLCDRTSSAETKVSDRAEKVLQVLEQIPLQFMVQTIKLISPS